MRRGRDRDKQLFVIRPQISDPSPRDRLFSDPITSVRLIPRVWRTLIY